MFTILTINCWTSLVVFENYWCRCLANVIQHYFEDKHNLQLASVEIPRLLFWREKCQHFLLFFHSELPFIATKTPRRAEAVFSPILDIQLVAKDKFYKKEGKLWTGFRKFCFTGKEFFLSTYLLLILAEWTITFKAILAHQLLLAFPGRHQWFNVAYGELCAVH